MPSPLRALRRLPLARRFRRWWLHRQTDVYIVSMPKAGRTWLKVLIGRVVQQHAEAPLEAITRTQHLHRWTDGLPRLNVTHDGYKPGMRPDEIRRDKSRYQGKRVILLIRDPRDVLVSLYFHDRYRREASIGNELSEMIHAERDGLRTIISFYNSWAAACVSNGSVMVVRYEMLKEDTSSEVRRVFEFLDVPWDTERLIDEAVEFAALDNMRKLEANDAFNTTAMRTADPSNPNAYKVRRGVVGGYVDYMSPADVDEMNTIIREDLAQPFSGFYG